MSETFKSKVPFPFEVMEVSSQTVTILDNNNYFTEQFDSPDEAKTLFFEIIGNSLIKKFIDGHELMWEEEEFEAMLMKATVEQAVNELESKKMVDVFENEDGEKIVVLRNQYL